MKAAVLCNGPSRTMFTSPDEYDYIIGCNIPWTKVDSTIVLDVGVVFEWWNNKLPLTPIWFSEMAWRETLFRNRSYFDGYFLGFVKALPEYDSSGHVACSKVIELGYKEIDIYGCDAWFTSNTDSYTHKYTDTRPLNTDKHVEGWRKRWNTIMTNNSDVKINFIGESK